LTKARRHKNRRKFHFAISVRDLVNRTAIVLLAITLVSSSTPAAPQTIVSLTKDSYVGFTFWFRASGLAGLVQGPDKVKAQEKQEERDAKISSIEIYPGDVIIPVGDKVNFAAVGYDHDGAAVGGLRFNWSVQDESRKSSARISPRGEFEAVSPGTFKILAEVGGRRAEVRVVVGDGHKKPTSKDRPVSIRQTSNRDRPGKMGALPKDTAGQNGQVASTSVEKTKDTRSSIASANTPKQTRRAISGARRLAHPRITAAPAAMPLPIDEGWNDGNYGSSSEPGNGIGDPPGGSLDDGAGSGNFQLKAPILSLSGRGINVNLGLSYNSRLWNKGSGQITYDIDHGWPAPGWSLGFGEVLFMGVNGGSMIAEADGTRRTYAGQASYYSYSYYGTTYSSAYFNGHTADGSLVDYSSGFYATNGTYNSGYAYARYANGTSVSYGAFGQNSVYPTNITDVNGNYITITYVNNTGPRIQTITDTMGRVVNFYYDANSLLTAVTTPGLSGGTRTLVRFHYHQISITSGSYSFSGLTPVVGNPYPWVLDGIYFPGTTNGYWFGDTDSYSTYGMLAKVIEQRGMGFSASSLTEQGSLSQGQFKLKRLYNYPLSPSDPGGSGLTDAPTYSSMTESWTRDGTNIDQATTSYEIHENATPRSVTITLPNGSKSIQNSYNHPGQYDDGLVYYDETRDSANVLLQSSSSSWQPGVYDSPRPTLLQKTDDKGQVTATEFVYGSVYNQVIEARDKGYANELLRSTRKVYQNNANYTANHIFNLPLTVEMYASDNVTRVFRAEYQYDGQTLTDTPNVTMHYQMYNPYAPQTWVDGYWDTQYDEYGYPYYVWVEGYWTTEYSSSTDYRGNVTQLTRYADAAGLTGAVNDTRRYDITGNLIKTSSSCCEQTTFAFTSDTQYAYAQSKTRGSATDAYAQVTMSSTVDFNTGLALSATDSNGRTSQTNYNSASLRPASVTLPTGAYTDYAYDDTAMSVTETTYLSSADGGAISNKNIKASNGLGKVRQEQALGANNIWDIVDTVYNNLGQVSQQTRPYRSGDTLRWVTLSYDSQGRPTRIVSADGSTTETYYNEKDFDSTDGYAPTRPSVASSSAGETTLVRDSWGRERWARTDASGKLVEVVEPNPAGNGSTATFGLVTTYSYDSMGNLVTITQGSQTRSFRYDALGRLTARKLAETDATLNDAGAYVGSGSWSDVLTYDERSNLITRKDARGVKTVYNYNNDPLNRLQSISWDTSDFGDSTHPILAAATVTYSYRTKSYGSQLMDVTQVSSMAAAGISTESYGYDSEGRLWTQTITLNSRSGYPLVTDYTNDSLDRLTDIRYPAEYGNGAQPRKVTHHNFDVASRTTSVLVDGQTQASSITYNAASQTSSLLVGSGTNQITENYGYSTLTGLLDTQTVARGGTTLLNLSYDYANASGKRSGQLLKISNNLNHTRDRGYEYDALGRLQRATGGQNVNWTQRYNYDRYGNRTEVFSYSADDYVKNFYQIAFTRQPYTNELQDATASLQTAYAQGQSQFLTAMGNLGESLFSSTTYANRNRSNHDYVYDLYKAYLFRDPDAGGWAWWESQVAANGRAAVRAAFLGSAEFAQKMNGTSPYLPPAGTVTADGWIGVGIDTASNRITSSGYDYDKAGNETRAQVTSSTFQRFRYDAANRLVQVLADDNTTVLASNTYGCSNQRLMLQEGSLRTYYAWSGGATIGEYTEVGGSTTPAWSKGYIFLGSRLLSTLTPNGGGGEVVQYHHPDRLGTRVVTNPADASSFEQVTLPFGMALSAESTGASNRRFTTYDRSASTGLDYAVNRHYDPQQGRFTQVDPAGMQATSLEHPQTLNLYSYCTNDPINHTDPNGLGFFSFLKKLFKFLIKVAIVVALVLAVVYLGPVLAGLIGKAIAAGFTLAGLGWAGLAFGLGLGVMFIGGMALGMVYSTIADALKRCKVPNFAGLSARRRDELTRLGVTPEQWNNLPNKNRLTFFNVTAAIAAAGLSLEGWRVDWAHGGIKHERVFFVAGPGASNLMGQVRATGMFNHGTNPRREHGDYTDSFRAGLHPSLQLSFTPDGTRLDADLDSFNPSRGLFALVLHGAEVTGHQIGHLFGGQGTDPVAIGNRKNWECS
jgi:RHS repeat-associated protein